MLRPLHSLAAAALAGLTALAPAPASADDAQPAARWVGTPVLPTHTGTLSITHERALTSANPLGRPFATGIDAAIAASPRLTLGISHSARALGTVDRGLGWCHEGGTHRCRAAYAGSFLDARWLAHRSADSADSAHSSRPRRRPLTITALARAGILGTDPLLPAVRLGLSLRTARSPTSRLWLTTQPEFQIALGHRDLGNRDTLIAPLWLGIGRRRAAAWLATGVRGGLAGFGDKWEIPFVLGGAAALGPARAGIELGFPRLLGPQNTGNVRHAALWLAFSM